jgi:hypothetical protein
MSQVFAQKEEVGATPDVVALLNNMNRCRFQTVMCCFTRRRAQNGGGSPADNTDVCRAQDVLTQGDQEGATHCHGFTWAGRDAAMTDANKRKLLDFVNTEDHFGTRGYFGAIGEYNKCDCIENMPIVSRSDCSELNGAANPKACDPRGSYGEAVGNGNNLADKYRSLGGNPALFSINLVGDCANSPPNAPALPDRGYVAPKSSSQAPKKTAVPDTGYEAPKTSTQAPKNTAAPDTGYEAPKTSSQAPRNTAAPDTGYEAPKTSTQAPKKTAAPDTGYEAPRTSTRAPAKTAVPDTGYEAPKTSTQAPKNTAAPDTGYEAPKTSTQAPKNTAAPDTGYEAPKTSTQAPKNTAAPDTGYEAPRTSTRAPAKTAVPDTGYEAPRTSTRAPAKTAVPDTGYEAPRTTVAPAPVSPSTPTPAPDSGAPKDCDSKK